MMNTTIFCQKCGANDQQVDSYCRQCGAWLPDIDAAGRQRLFRKKTREEKFRKMRILEVVSAALAFVSAAIIFSVLSGTGDISLLNLAGLCCVLTAVYQAVNFYFGYTLQPRRNQDQIEEGPKARQTKDMLPELEDHNNERFIEMPTVTEKTTELLSTKRNQD